MKKTLLTTFFLAVLTTFAFAQKQIVTLTVKVKIEMRSDKATTELIKVENGIVENISLPDFFVNTEEHEKQIQKEIEKIIIKGFGL